jgi:hypothetical protein
MAVDRRGGGVGSSGETGDRAADAGRFGWTAVKRRPSTRCSANGASKPTLPAERVSSVGSAGGQSRPPITHPLLSQPQRHPLSHHSQPHSSPTLLTPALYEKPRRSRTVVLAGGERQSVIGSGHVRHAKSELQDASSELIPVEERPTSANNMSRSPMTSQPDTPTSSTHLSSRTAWPSSSPCCRDC